MARASTNQDSFLGGEISPLSEGRVTIPRYKECLAKCENYVPLLQGPKTRRPGTEFIGRTQCAKYHSRLIPFSFSANQDYVIEISGASQSDGYTGGSRTTPITYTVGGRIRVYQNGAPVLRSENSAQESQVLTVTAVTNANPISITASIPAALTRTNYNVVGATVYAKGFVGMEELNGRGFVIKSISGSPGSTQTITLAISQSEGDYTGTTGVDSTGYGVYTSGGTLTPYFEMLSPYLDTDIDAIQYAQSDDVIYLAHPSYAPRKITREGAVVNAVLQDPFVFALVSFLDGPYGSNLGTDILGATLGGTVSYSTSTGYITFSIPNLSIYEGPFAPGLGDGSLSESPYVYIRAYTGSQWIYARAHFQLAAPPTHFNLIAYTWYVCGTRNTTTPASFTATSFRIGSWYPSVGFPSTVVFYQDRLVFGGKPTEPSRFDGSFQSDYENFNPTDSVGNVTAANSYSFTLASQDFNKICWMTSDERGLLMGTSNAEWVVNGGGTGAALSAVSISANKTTSIGGQPIQAAQLGRCSIYVQRGGLKVRELQPTLYTTTGFNSNDLTEFAEHISKTGIIGFGVQKTPQTILWAVRADGTILSMTYEHELDALKVGWARHLIGGVNAAAESIAVIPSITDDQIYLEVKRTIGGKTLRYIEYITPFFKSYDTLTSAFFVDSGLSYSGSATTTISGLNHLNGEKLAVLGDGNVIYDGVTSYASPINGRITLPVSCSNVSVGYPYYSKGQKLRSDAGAADGTAMGKTRRTNRVGFNLLNTQGLQFGPDFTSLDDLTLDSTEAGVLAVSPALFSGITTQLLAGGYDFDNKFCWQQYQPLPGTVLGIFPDQETQDR